MKPKIQLFAAFFLTTIISGCNNNEQNIIKINKDSLKKMDSSIESLINDTTLTNLLKDSSLSKKVKNTVD